MCRELETRIMAIDLAVVRHGLICLTFDDGLYEQWLPQLPLFAEYRANVTFFFNGLLEKRLRMR